LARHRRPLTSDDALKEVLAEARNRIPLELYEEDWVRESAINLILNAYEQGVRTRGKIAVFALASMRIGPPENRGLVLESRIGA
jgi:hypothetical protein